MDWAAMIHLGEYLVKRKVLSAIHLLKALAEQRKRRKYLPLLLVELGALADHRALRYCSLADQKGKDFLEVLRCEGVISKAQCQQIRLTWMQSGPPIGQLLVEMGFLNRETLEMVLEEFEAEKALMRSASKLVS
jgi:hypothetical protein